MPSETNTGFNNPRRKDAKSRQEDFQRLLESIQSGANGNELSGLVEDCGYSLEYADSDQLGRFMLEIANRRSLAADPQLTTALEGLFVHLVRAIRRKPAEFDDDWFAGSSLESVYRELPAESNARGQLLAAMTCSHSSRALGLFAELISDDPPADERGALIGISPLVNHPRIEVDLLFPKLLEALRYKHLAAMILDLANFVFRSQLTSQHPVRPRAQQLTALLGQVVNQLAMIEEGQLDGQSADEISQTVNESVALTVALCDALALAKHGEAIGKVRQALDLKHRRVKTEAAAALIRLGDTDQQEGRQQLIALAAEPICRLRVLEFAKELEMLDQIDPVYQTEAARSASQLALWLAAPGQMGVAPTTLELVHQSSLRWPGYDHEVDCYLYRFEYRFAGQSYSNIGIVGPLTHAFACNLEHLTPLEVLAAFAGWATEHEDIYLVDFAKAQQAVPGVTESLSRKLRSESETAEPALLGYFFETPVLIGESQKSDQPDRDRLYAVDRDHIHTIAKGAPFAPITVEMAFEIYKGLQLLVAFNDVEVIENKWLTPENDKTG